MTEATPSRVVITGASGRVGRVIAAEIAARHEAVGVDLAPGPQTQVIADFTDAHAMREVLRGARAVVHVASLHVPDLDKRDRADFERVNVAGTRQLLELAGAAGVREFIYTSTTSIYGDALVPSDRAVWVTEALTPRPRDIYDETKLAAEQLCRDAARAGMRVTVLRFSRCFPEPWPEFALYRCYRGVDARDVAQAHVLSIGRLGDAFALCNVSAATPFHRDDCEPLWRDAPAVLRLRVPELVAAFSVRGWPLPARIDRVYVIEQAKRVLGYRPKGNVDSVLAQLPPPSAV